MMQNLIERLQSATAPDRKLDLRVAQALGVKITEYEIISEGQTWKAYDDAWPRYTSSIDAALTLVPENYYASIHTDVLRQDGETEKSCSFVAFSADPKASWTQNGSDGATPAIALCIAALKARQSMETK